MVDDECTALRESGRRSPHSPVAGSAGHLL